MPAACAEQCHAVSDRGQARPAGFPRGQSEPASL
jgi:hypothetical protein